MLKKTITYTDFNGRQQTEEYYFNLSTSELARMEFNDMIIKDESAHGGLKARLESIVASGSGKLIIETFEMILKESYGERSDDGKRFMKSEEIWENFRYSPAYDVLFMELVTDAKAAAEFMNGVVPADLEKQMNQLGGSSGQQPQDHLKAANKQSGTQTIQEYPEHSAPESQLSEDELAVIREMRAKKQD